MCGIRGFLVAIVPVNFACDDGRRARLLFEREL